MSGATKGLRVRLAVGGVLLTLLLAAVFTMGSLDVPIEPRSWREILALYAVSSLITAALLVFGLILTRSIVRLWAERSKQLPGARFKTKMVLGAMAISLLPVVFMFFVSYSLLNRTLGRWFPRPLEIVSDETQRLLNDLGKSTAPRLRAQAYRAESYASEPAEKFLSKAVEEGLDAAWIYDAEGHLLKGGVSCDEQPEARTRTTCVASGVAGTMERQLPSGLEVWRAAGETYLISRVPWPAPGGREGVLVAGYRTTPDFLQRWNEIQSQSREYERIKQNLRALKRQMLLILFFFTLLVLSAATWVALFLAKQVTVPILALSEGTREVSAGNFAYQVPDQPQDELGMLVRSFNTMTTQLSESRSQIDEFTRNLQQAVQELERRRQLMETVLENIPAGVIYLDQDGRILKTNSALSRMFDLGGLEIESLESLLGTEGLKQLQQSMKRSLRMGVVSGEMEVVAAGRLLHLAVTVSSLGPRRANTGFVLVFDDLTEMLRAQKSAAWEEVARRIAHEIKNPLTPIQLSAQRLARQVERETPNAKELELARIAKECSLLIQREVSTLSALVNEFSQFVRFPSAKLQPTDANATVRDAVEIFAGRLENVVLKTELVPGLPPVRADGGLLRSVLVNLIDNAAEALEDATTREIHVRTRLRVESDTVEIAVSDTGHGISPSDKDKLFLPHFSTKDRGTGLGLAIAARIIGEHGGSLRVEDNQPVGSRFLIELPVADMTTAALTEKTGTESER